MAKDFYKNQASPKEDVFAYFLTRNVDRTCPPIANYLSDNGLYLDVGCGPGSITVDVAKRVPNGHIIGVDSSADAIEKAKGWAENHRVTNVEFMVGDAYGLDFPDGQYDGVYAINVVSHLDDPLSAFKEWARLTKPGGWVCATIGTGERFFYPKCTVLLDIFQALGKYQQKDLNIGPNGREILAKAGLVDVELYLHNAPELYTSRYMKKNNLQFVDLNGPHKEYLKKVIDAKFITEEMVNTARKEIEQWLIHPYRYIYQVDFWAAGRVPLWDFEEDYPWARLSGGRVY